MIGISEGMVLAERYRLVRRHEDLGAGEFWGAVDQETGSEAWVCFSDRPGLGEIAERMRGWQAPATPRILDSGEVRLILDSRTLGAAGAAGRAATHVEVAVEFAVQEPALGKPLPGRFARRPLPPAEVLALVALLAGALDEALGAGYSHGWLTASSAWNLRRRVCLVDLAAGLAVPDSDPVEIADQVSGYYAPERIAGGPATEAADVFALGWLLYAALVGQANLDAYYSETVSAAGSASTAELLALWRDRSREHVRFLLAQDEALAALLLAALADNPADRPTLAAFQATAMESARTHAGAAALVAYQPKKRPVAAAAAGVVAAAEGAAGVVAAGVVAPAEGAAVAGAVVAGAVEGAAAMESAESSESTATAESAAAMQSVAAAEVVEVGAESAAGGALAATAAVESVAATEVVAAATAVESASAVEAVSAAEGVGAAGGRRRRERPRVGVGLLVACALGLLMIGLGSGYAFGASGNQAAANSKSGIGLGAVVSATTGAACAPTAAASVAATATWNENAALPLPTSSAGAVTQLGQIVQGAESSGLISSVTAGTLSSEIGAVQSAIASGGSYSGAWQTLSQSIQSGRSQGTIPQALSLQLVSALSYLSEAAGS